MGKCALSFDQIQIVNKRSDHNHSDNDWLIITWFVDGTEARKDKVQLIDSADGSVVLETGSVAQTISSEVSCRDGDFVTATFAVMNLGSTDFSEQADAAGRAAESFYQKVAEVYFQVIELALRGNPTIPLNDMWADGIKDLGSSVVDAIGSAWDGIIASVDDVLGFIRILAGHPDCNGVVLFDTVAYGPNDPVAAETWTGQYSAGEKSGCGTPAHTSVVYTRDRQFDPEPQFPSIPPPKTDVASAEDWSPQDWYGAWAEDPSTLTPILLVRISASETPAVTPLFDVEIVERVDPRFAAVFHGGGTLLPARRERVPISFGNAFASIRPWVDQPVSPAQLTLHGNATTFSDLPGNDVPMGPAGSPEPTIRLAWNRPRVGGDLVALFPTKPTGLTSAIGHDLPKDIGSADSALSVDSGLGGAGAFTDDVDVIDVPAQGVRLCLYAIRQGGNVIANTVRYLRSENGLYTAADVMLARWNPAR